MTDRLVVALEAPSYSGKSTLSRELQRRAPNMLVSLPDYMDVPIDEPKPTAPASDSSAHWDSFQFFLRLDAERTRQARSANQLARIELLDRSIHTLLAHVYAIEQLQGWVHYSRALASAFANLYVCWPDVIVYLDAPQSLLASRYGSRGETVGEELFTRSDYNAHFREYFVPTPPCPPNHNHRFVIVDASEPTHTLANTVISIIEEAVGSSGGIFNAE